MRSIVGMLVATVWTMLSADAAAGQFEMRNCLRGKVIHVLAYNENDKVRIFWSSHATGLAYDRAASLTCRTDECLVTIVMLPDNDPGLAGAYDMSAIFGQDRLVYDYSISNREWCVVRAGDGSPGISSCPCSIWE